MKGQCLPLGCVTVAYANSYVVQGQRSTIFHMHRSGCLQRGALRCRSISRSQKPRSGVTWHGGPMQWMHDITPSIAVCCTACAHASTRFWCKDHAPGQSYCLSEILSVEAMSDKSGLYAVGSSGSTHPFRTYILAGHCRRYRRNPHASCDRFRHTSRILATLPVFCTAPASLLVCLPALVMTRILLSCRHNNCLLQNPARGSSGTTAS
jgi:hypothetical protein